jgi:hypothetical protein
MPIIAHVLAVQTTAKAGWAKAPSIGADRGWGSNVGRNCIFELLLASRPARLVRDKRATLGLGEEVARHSAERPLAQTAVAERAGHDQVGFDLLRDPSQMR